MPAQTGRYQPGVNRNGTMSYPTRARSMFTRLLRLSQRRLQFLVSTNSSRVRESADLWLSVRGPVETNQYTELKTAVTDASRILKDRSEKVANTREGADGVRVGSAEERGSNQKLFSWPTLEKGCRKPSCAQRVSGLGCGPAHLTLACCSSPRPPRPEAGRNQSSVS